MAEALLCGLAAGPTVGLFSGYFSGTGAASILGGAALVASLTGSLAAGRRSTAAARIALLPIGCLLALVLLYPGPLRHDPADALVTVAEDLGASWGRLLSVNLPSDPRPGVVLLPFLLVWTSTWLAAVSARRWTAPLAPSAPVLAGFILALLVVAADGEPHTGWAMGEVGVIVLLTALRATRRRAVPRGEAPAHVSVVGGIAGRPRDTTLLASVGLLASTAVMIALGMAAAAGAAALSPGPPFDVRTIHPPPVQLPPTVTPLNQVRPQLVGAAAPLFDLRLSGEAEGSVDRVRTAVLDEYDGVLWTSTARFFVAGRVLARRGTDGAVGEVRAEVSLRVRAGPFLPTVGEPVGLEIGDLPAETVGFDPQSGSLVSTQQLAAGSRYLLVARAATSTAGLGPVLAATPDIAQDLQVPHEIPADLRRRAAELLAGPGTAFERLRRFQDDLRALPYDLQAPAGHSLADLDRMLGASAGSPPSGGYDEQHAAAFALIARLNGLPARVAVGYTLGRTPPPATAGMPSRTAPTSFEVTTHQAHAWPEVFLGEYGWVPFEPTDPTRLPTYRRQTRLAAAAPDAPAGVPPTSSSTRRGAGGGGEHRSVVDPVRNALLWLLIWSGAVGLAAVVTAMVVIPLVKAVRRRRRGRGGPPAQVLGAWMQALDLLAERLHRAGPGRPLLLVPADTPLTVARKAAGSFGPTDELAFDLPALHALAVLVTRLQHQDAPVTEQDATVAWSLVEETRRALDAAHGSLLNRVRVQLAPAPLWRRSAMERRARRDVRDLLGGRLMEVA